MLKLDVPAWNIALRTATIYLVASSACDWQASARSGR